AEGVLDRLATHAHLTRVRIKSSLHGLKKMLVLPAGDAPLRARRALRLDRAGAADAAPIAAQDQPMFLVRVAIGQAFAGRADVSVVLGHIAKVLLAEAPFGLCSRGHRL